PAGARSAWWVATGGGQGRAGTPRSLLRIVGVRRRYLAAIPPASGGADDSLHERNPQAADLLLPLVRRAHHVLPPNPPAPLPPPGAAPAKGAPLCRGRQSRASPLAGSRLSNTSPRAHCQPAHGGQ